MQLDIVCIYPSGVIYSGRSSSPLRATTGCKGRALFAPIRAALTGRVEGPELARVLAYLGPERIRERLTRAEEIARGAD